MGISFIFKEYRWRIIATFSLLVLENVARVFQPLLLGLAINDLLEGDNQGLWWFGALYIFGFMVGTARRYYDTRVYTAIYANTATHMATANGSSEMTISAITARSSLIKELVDFFEHDLPQAFSSVIGVVGAIVLLATFHLWIALGCLLCIILILAIYGISTNRIYAFNVGLNDELEKRVDVLHTRAPKSIFNHFRSIARWMVKMSDLDTLNYGLVELLLFGLAVFALFMSVQMPNATAGSIFSVLTYVLEFAEGIYMLPMVFQQLIRLREIRNRLENA
ncbi:ABC transporter six-transmembrane domain-containing protein [Sediminicola luteus]|uniref:ABC transmembrane type-1 domain-containing protein n=1 Tax=Sediminicola luteus TaxID=319238 RepID=A0A2A4G8Q1_9FLAO|nr:ABC transporter six-transmembrane domain-containing protein [Sediminicola luteus]PCE64791.1 hypothetical protein B7P33_06370 [Sediminicola luteus]